MDITLIYDETTGRIVDMISNQDHDFNLDHNINTGEAAVLSTTEANSKVHYIADLETTPILTARPASPITLDGTTLKDVPAGAIINIDGTEEVIETAEDVELVFPLSGTYEVRVKHFPYLDFVTEVTV